MLSICIPIYNYDVTQLVRDLHRQAVKSGNAFEILLMDDVSGDEYKIKNQRIDLAYVRYIQLEKNIGRVKIRNALATEACYPYLLFMDCDSAIDSELYIENYLPFCKPFTVCYGGRKYEAQRPKDNTFLRWKYGVERESLPAEIRNRKPNYNFCTNNFLIHKSVFEQVKFNEKMDGYGHEDTFFALELLEQGIIIKHIDNPLIHLGLEPSSIFLEKTENSILNLLKIEKILKENNSDHIEHSKLMQTKALLQKMHLIRLTATLFKMTKPFMKKHLLGKHPTLLIFDLYKLGQICQLRMEN